MHSDGETKFCPSEGSANGRTQSMPAMTSEALLVPEQSRTLPEDRRRSSQDLSRTVLQRNTATPVQGCKKHRRHFVVAPDRPDPRKWGNTDVSPSRDAGDVRSVPIAVLALPRKDVADEIVPGSTDIVRAV